MIEDGTVTNTKSEFHLFGRTIEFITAIVPRKEQGQKKFHFFTYHRNGAFCFSIRFLKWQINFEKF